MKILSVTGGAALNGRVTIHGAKNSVLPVLAAAVLCRGPCVLQNCPQIEDVETSLAILRALGCRAERQGDRILLDTGALDSVLVPPEQARRMRSSILFLGALTARAGRACIALPGGCRLGARPIDLHLAALRAMGAEITEEAGGLVCHAERLHGARIRFPFPSVGATENALLAAVGSDGDVVLENVAAEPEIGDLIGFLQSAGASIEGVGTRTLCVHGGASLHGTQYTILPDRIETATYLCAAAACGGDVCLNRTRPQMLRPVLMALRTAGCRIEETEDTIRLVSDGKLTAPGNFVTAPYPGFPTDAQAPMMAALLRARGQTEFTESIFEDRFRHVEELCRLGARIAVNGMHATVCGTQRLYAAQLHAGDLRGGAALVIAAMQAEGNSRITGVKHIERGYDKLEENLRVLGAQIKTVDIS